jgi:hypothetical protein
VFFKIIGKVSDVETIAQGTRIRELSATVEGLRSRPVEETERHGNADGSACHAEVPWYEAHGIGAKEFKIKRILEIQ